MPSTNSVTDPVCGMRLESSSAADTREHLGETYHFCSAWCARKFDKDADAYIAASRLRDNRDQDNTEDPHPDW
jgi:P-type Cu+ transporter